ncbi:hypothetical protein ACFYWP_39860 [Actinacidiphila glaucinigra]|uniref:hypothetical protein n=1 Tax=Actinacidiphila glaucinigra TaxID=235986 RepID=UPI00369C29F7
MSGSSRKSRTNGDVARRRAVLERVRSRVAEERRQVEEAEAARRRRESELEELAVDFELATQDVGRVAEEIEEQVRRVRARGEAQLRAARVRAARVVVAMGAVGETVAGCGRRLGVSAERVKELRRLAREDDAGDGEPGGAGAGRGGGDGDGAETAGEARPSGLVPGAAVRVG